MKNLWMRFGVNMKLTDEECEDILGDDFDAGRMAQILREVVAEGRFELEGESYVPEIAIFQFNECYGTEYRSAEPECYL